MLSGGPCAQHGNVAILWILALQGTEHSCQNFQDNPPGMTEETDRAPQMSSISLGYDNLLFPFLSLVGGIVVAAGLACTETTYRKLLGQNNQGGWMRSRWMMQLTVPGSAIPVIQDQSWDTNCSHRWRLTKVALEVGNTCFVARSWLKLQCNPFNGSPDNGSICQLVQLLARPSLQVVV